MKEIILNKGFKTLVDDWNYDWLNKWKWRVFYNHGNYYVRRWNRLTKKSIYMHRLIMNTPVGLEVDHGDHNGLNNQEYNLTNCTVVKNQQNKKVQGKSKYRGVTFNQGKIRAILCMNGITIHLGYCKTQLQAAKRYDMAAINLLPEVINLNFPNKKD